MLTIKRFKKKRFWGFVVIAAVIVAIIWSLVLFYNHKDEGGIIIESERGGWHTYLNETFGFKIDFPDNWLIYEQFNDGAPIINIYESRFGLIPPFDQFSDVNSVSIYPNGAETEIIIGETKESEIEINADTDEVTDYLLSSNDVWATYVSFDESDSSWTPWGFIWARLMIDGSDYSCQRKGEDLSIDDCNPLDGDVFVRHGEVDDEIRIIEVEILESFEFIEN